MSDKILVTYASRAGSTAGVAVAIGKTLLDGGLQVDVRPMDEVNECRLWRLEERRSHGLGCCAPLGGRVETITGSKIAMFIEIIKHEG